MTHRVYYDGAIHRPGCPHLEGVDARPATPSDHDHAAACSTCRDGTSQYDSRERGDVRNDDHLLTDGGVELREGETRDDAHARRNAEALASARRARFGQLPDSEQAVLETLTAADGAARAQTLKTAVGEECSLSPSGVQHALERLAEKDLVERETVLTNPRETRWLVTDRGRALVRAGGER